MTAMDFIVYMLLAMSIPAVALILAGAACWLFSRFPEK